MKKYTQTSIDISSCPEPKLCAPAASADSPVPGKFSAIEQKRAVCSKADRERRKAPSGGSLSGGACKNPQFYVELGSRLVATAKGLRVAGRSRGSCFV